MSTEPITSSVPEPAASQPATPHRQPPPIESIPVIITPRGLEAVKFYRQEIIAYLRELPRLLEEGEAGRHALVKGNEILSIWDTFGDGLQAGHDRFGLEPIFLKKVDPRDLELLHVWDKYLKETACPS